MKKSFIIGALLVAALIGGISYGYSTYSSKNNPTSNEKIYSELDAKMAKAEDTKDNDLKKNKDKEVSNKNKDNTNKKNIDISDVKNKEKDIKTKKSYNELTNEEKDIIKVAEKYEGVSDNKDVETLIGDKKIVNGETYYHIHIVSKSLINQGGSGTIDDFYINKYGKVLKNVDVEKRENDNSIDSKIIKLAERYEGVENDKDIVTVISNTKKVNEEIYYHIHMTSKKLINQGGSGTVDDFYINENGKVLKNTNN